MNMPRRMRGVWLTGHGDVDVLEIRDDIPVPVLADGEVLIKVAAAGVNNTDINTRTGWYSKRDSASDDASWTGKPIKFPLIQGADVCGRIVAVASGISERRIGERVLIEPCFQEAGDGPLDKPCYFGSDCDGGFAEYAIAPARYVHAVECDLGDVEVASFPCSYSTAENLLIRTQVESDDCVLVTGASGGVGSAVIQLAKARGARVIAVTSAEKSAAILSLGAEQVVLRGVSPVKEVGRDSVDVVIDLVGGEQWPELLDVLRPGGRYGVSGAIAGPLVELDLRTLYLKDLSFFGATVLEPKAFPNLIKRIESRQILPLVAETYPLHLIGDAQVAFQAKKHIGKIVLSVDVEQE